jgi:hypothetical protein
VPCSRSAGKIDVDIPPFVARLGQESLKQESPADRVDCGDAQRVANCAVRRGTTAVAENAFLPAEADDVLKDQKAAGELQLVDERKLSLGLLPGFCTASADRSLAEALFRFDSSLSSATR